MSPLLRGLYKLLKVVTHFVFRIYYPDTRVTNEQYLDYGNPAIVVSNHPNTLVDALQSAARVHPQVFFLVNAGLYKNPIMAWLFDKLYCVPIQRPQDTDGKPLQNTRAFDRCEQHLLGGGSLYIAPEGTSFMNRCLRPFRTGTARIALGAEQRSGFNAGITILPIGLNYEKPECSNSRLLVNVGEPLVISPYKQAYDKDPVEAVRQLTKDLEDRVRHLVIDTLDEEEDHLVHILEHFIPEEKDAYARFLATKKLIAALHRLKTASPQAAMALEHRAKEYQAHFQQLGIALNTADALASKPAIAIRRWLLLVLGAPVFLYGWINHLLPAGIPVLLARKLKLYVGYDSTVKMVAGLVTFPLFYFLQYYFINRWLPGSWPLLYLITLPLFGWIIRPYQKLAGSMIDCWRWRQIWRTDPQLIANLKKQHGEINVAVVGMLGEG